MLPVVNQQLLKEHIDLEQNGIIEILLEKEANLEKFIQIFESIKKLIEIASIRQAVKKGRIKRPFLIY